MAADPQCTRCKQTIEPDGYTSPPIAAVKPGSSMTAQY